MNIGLTRGKPDPVKSADYNDLDRRIRALQAQSSALYENDEISDAELAGLVAPIHAEIAELIDLLYLPTKSRAGRPNPAKGKQNGIQRNIHQRLPDHRQRTGGRILPVLHWRR